MRHTCVGLLVCTWILSLGALRGPRWCYTSGCRGHPSRLWTHTGTNVPLVYPLAERAELMDDSRDPYDAIAEWYDVEHDAFAEDVECYLALLAAARDGQARVLEIGSGTGRIAAKLAAAGHTVTGIEPSRAMRLRCESRLAGLPERVRRRIQIIAGTASQPNLPASERFDAVLYGLNTFAHLIAVDERQTALRNASLVLRPNGQLLLDLDLLGPRKLASEYGKLLLQGQWRLANGASYLTHMVSAALSEQPGAIDVHHFYDVFEQGGNVKRTLSHMTLAALSFGEVIGALMTAGFAVEATYGGHDLSPYDNDSSCLIVDARVPPS